MFNAFAATLIVHEENRAYTRGKIYLDVRWVFMAIATNADQRKWREICISAVSRAATWPTQSMVPVA